MVMKILQDMFIDALVVMYSLCVNIVLIGLQLSRNELLRGSQVC